MEKVTIIIPVLEDYNRLQLCLSLIDRNEYPKDLIQVLVIDNGSKNIDFNMLKKYSFAKLLFESTTGSYAARNKGLLTAKGDVLAFTDSDCQPHKEWIANGVRALNNKHSDLIAGKIILFFKNNLKKTMSEALESFLGFPQKMYVEKDKFGATANLFVKREVFDKAGLFNSTLTSSGDLEFCQRAIKKGFIINYCEHCIVYHPARYHFVGLVNKVRRLIGGFYQVCINTKQYKKLFKRIIIDISPPVFLLKIFFQKKYKDRTFKDKLKAYSCFSALKFFQLYEWARILFFNDRPKNS